MSYSKPILIELYSETHFESSTLLSEHFFDIVPKLKGIGFDDVELGAVDVISIDAEKESLAHSNAPRVRCWGKDRLRLVQLSEDLLIINLVGEYPGWGAFAEVFSSVHTVLPRNVLSKAESLALNTIDRFRVGRKGYRMGRFLACGGAVIPAWYQNSAESADLTMGRGILEENGFNRQIRVKVRVHSDVVIDIRSTFHDLLRRDSLRETLERLHLESTQSFESLITDETRISVMGGVKSYANHA